MSKQILFLGDTSLTTAAAYLGGCLSSAGWEFDYRPTGTAVTLEDVQVSRSLFIISDYPACDIPEGCQRAIAEQVLSGAGLLMIGGWESFQGLNGTAGGWQGSVVEDLLPVEISKLDDRQNCDMPVFVTREKSHVITSGLPWEERPPLIGGYNHVVPKTDSKTILSARRTSAIINGNEVQLTFERNDPLLVLDDSTSGRRAALMTDLAPHWIGPMVDWGNQRVAAQAPDAEMIEVGNYYLRFVQQLIAWVGRLELKDKLD